MNNPQLQATFEQEVTALSNKNYAESCGSMPISKPGSAEFRKEMSNKTPVERLKMNISQISILLNEDIDYININVDDRNKMCKLVDYVKIVGVYPRYINALAYVMGYYIYMQNCIINEDNDTKKIKTNKITKYNKIVGTPDTNFMLLKHINDISSSVRSGNSFSVSPADVIRYGKLWNRLIEFDI